MISIRKVECSIINLSVAFLLDVRILQLTKKYPYPLTSGEAWAVMALAEGLTSHGALIDLFSINHDQHLADQASFLALKEKNIYENIEIVSATVSTSKLRAIINLYSTRSYHAERFEQVSVAERLMAWLAVHQYDVILVETVYMMHYVQVIRASYPEVRVVLRAHNVEHVIWQRYAQGCNPWKSWYFKEQSRRLKQYESVMMKTADLIMPVSQHDAHTIKDMIGQETSIHVAPIGMTAFEESNDTAQKQEPIVFGFLGLLDWRPNVEGLRWFIDEVWPVIIAKHNAILKIAGRNGKGWSYSKSSGIFMIGAVDDSDEFLRSIDMMIAPLLSGSGTRVKILQSFRVQTPVISTTIGMEGLLITHKEELLIADTVDEWSCAIEDWLGDENLGTELVENGMQYLSRHHSKDQIARKVLSTITAL